MVMMVGELVVLVEEKVETGVAICSNGTDELTKDSTTVCLYRAFLCTVTMVSGGAVCKRVCIMGHMPIFCCYLLSCFIYLAQISMLQ